MVPQHKRDLRRSGPVGNFLKMGQNQNTHDLKSNLTPWQNHELLCQELV